MVPSSVLRNLNKDKIAPELKDEKYPGWDKKVEEPVLEEKKENGMDIESLAKEKVQPVPEVAKPEPSSLVEEVKEEEKTQYVDELDAQYPNGLSYEPVEYEDPDDHHHSTLHPDTVVYPQSQTPE